jgi:hypothetical protein
MEKERPAVVQVFAILNIVFGSLGAVIWYCAGAIIEPHFGLLTSSEWALPDGSTMRVPPFPSDAMAVSIADLVIRFILCIALIFAGLGLVGMNAWARKLSIVLGITGILWALVMPATNTLYLKPKIERWEKDLTQAVRNHLKNQQLPPRRQLPPALSATASLFMPVLISTYSVVMLGFMLRPQISAAFAGQPIIRKTEWDREPRQDFR